MTHDIAYYAKKRHTTKAFNPNKKISHTDIEKIKEILRYAPSSVNAQPWHFIVASTEEGKKRIAKSAEGMYSFNKNSILNASHVIVFCTKLELNEEYLLKVLKQEETDNRFKTNPAFKEMMHGARNMFINIHKHDYKDLQHWMDKQVYLNIGAFLLGVATLGIDAAPMEGVDIKILDEELGLREKGYTGLVVIPIGYHDSENDYNVKLEKSRLPYSEILTEI